MISSILSDLWCFSTFTFQQIELIELYIYVKDTRIEYYLCVWTLSLISFHSVKIFRWQESFSIVFNIIIGVWAIVRCIRVQRDRDSDLLRYVYIYIIELVKYTSFIHFIEKSFFSQLLPNIKPSLSNILQSKLHWFTITIRIQKGQDCKNEINCHKSGEQ